MAQPALDQRRQERHRRDHSGAGGQPRDRHAREVRPAEQPQVEHRGPQPQLDQGEHHGQPDTATEQEQHQRRSPARPALDETGEHRGQCPAEQRHTEQVDGLLPVGARLGEQPPRQQSQHGRQHGDQPVRPAPAERGAHRGGEQRPRGDSAADARAPDAGGVHPARAGRERVADQPQAAGEDRRRAEPLADASQHQHRRGGREGAEHRRHRQHDGTDHEHPAPPVVVADRPGRQQRHGQPEAHRAQDPRLAGRAGAESRSRAGQGGDRRGVGDQRQHRADRRHREGAGLLAGHRRDRGGLGRKNRGRRDRGRRDRGHRGAPLSGLVTEPQLDGSINRL